MPAVFGIRREREREREREQVWTFGPEGAKIAFWKLPRGLEKMFFFFCPSESWPYGLTGGGLAS